jgi:hypothetical protein
LSALVASRHKRVRVKQEVKQEVKQLREAVVLRALRAAMVVTTMMLILMMFGRSFAMVRIA